MKVRAKMEITGVIYSPEYLKHNTGRDHPESPNRLRSIMDNLEKNSFLRSKPCRLLSPSKANQEDVESVHDREYVKIVEKMCSLGGGLLDLGDTVVSSESFNVALTAVGGVLKAVDLVMENELKNAFALVRPPGHHAGRDYAMGFCLFNNVAIAAVHLLKNYGLERILIFDFDSHHGNGTQEIFYNSRKVFYLSIHQNPIFFPGTGYTDQKGVGEGLGYNFNLPLPFNSDDKIFLSAIDGIVVPLIRQFKPQIILASAGFDGHYSDPVAALSLTGRSYVRIADVLTSLSDEFCKGKLVLALEGGYNLRFLGKIVTYFISTMSGGSYSFNDKDVGVNREVHEEGRRAIEAAKKEFSLYWNL